MSTLEMNLDGTGPAGQHANTHNDISGREEVKVWLKKKNAAMQTLKSAKALLDGEFPDIPIPENGAAILEKLSGELEIAEAGLKECRRVRQLMLSKKKRDVAKANADRFRAASIAATFASVNGAGEAPPSPDSRPDNKRKRPESDDDAPPSPTSRTDTPPPFVRTHKQKALEAFSVLNPPEPVETPLETEEDECLFPSPIKPHHE